MKANRLYVDFHVIQTVPPSCVNRDDTGSPKTAVYGGVQRARVSSQSWKRAVRSMFRETFDEAELGMRTKKIVEMVHTRILALAEQKGLTMSEDEAQNKAIEIINMASADKKKPIIPKPGKDGVLKTETDALFFMSGSQAEKLAELSFGQEIKPAQVKNALNTGTGVDVALFGRLVTNAPDINTDASCQVAHAISTHRVDNEFDYFTAVDDMAPADNAGAGMIGTVEFNSSTLYRYATVAAHDLFLQLENSPGATAKAIKEFTRAFITSMPTGKQNTFANRTLPDGVVVVIRSDQPVNMVGAFEEPVYGGEGGYAAVSREKLATYMVRMQDDYCGVPEQSWVIGEGLSELGTSITLPALLAELETELHTKLLKG